MPSAETLLWLNEHVGQEFRVELLFTRGRERKTFAVLTGDGILRDWSEGWYAVGETHFDPTDLDGSIRRRTDDELILELADGAYLHLMRQGASPSSFSLIR
jgi:hypothetical protein